jgi:Transposase DDE domain
MTKGQRLIKYLHERIASFVFISNHKENQKDFSRDRVLTFMLVFMLILRNTIKSLQLSLNELFINGNINQVVSSSAYSQARKKFKHTAFMELNEGTIDLYYSDNKIKRWRNYRCFGVDASTIILPNTPDIKKEFGEIKIKTQHIEDNYTCAIFECCYDVLNRIAYKSILSCAGSYEVDLAGQMLKEPTLQADDLLIYDRGYASYEFLAMLKQQSKNYIVRIPKNSFKETQVMFEGKGPWSKVVTVKVPPGKKRSINEKGLPAEIKVRFVSVVLSTGEIEVLATSLIDKSIKREEFKMLYGLRWGVERFFNLLKGRLCLENFTGKTAKSVKQDFWSTIFISNVETVLTEETEQEINSNQEAGQLPKQINHAVSFNAIKNMAFDIFLNDKDYESSMRRLKILFKTGTISQRKDRSTPRRKPSPRRSCHFLRRIKKYVF